MNAIAPDGLALASKSFVELLFHWELTKPEDVYLVQPDAEGTARSYSWVVVADQVRRMAGYLKTLDLPPGSRIALLGKNSAHWVMADLAIWVAGHVSVPIYPTLDADNFGYVLEHSEAALLFIGKLDGNGDNWAQLGPAIPSGLPCIRLPFSPEVDAPHWEKLVAAAMPLLQPVAPEPSALATIIYTSGSTGRPKGVMHSFQSMSAILEGTRAEFGFTEQERFLSYLPLAHTAERAYIECLSLYCGSQVFFAWSLDTFRADLQRARPTAFFSVPRLWSKFQAGVNAQIAPWLQRWLFNIPLLGRRVKRGVLAGLGLEHARLAITGSAPLPPEVFRWYQRLGLEMKEVYGMTENFGYSHGIRRDGAVHGCIGRANPGVSCKLSDTGEILVKSPGGMLGYYKNPEKTTEDLTADGYLRTGDLGELDAAGRLRITGRSKDLFKTAKGKYVPPAPIEQQLGNHPLVEVCCVCGEGMPQPVALLVLSDSARAEAADLRAREAMTLELEDLGRKVNAGVPKETALHCLVVVRESWSIDSGLLTPTMKIKRHEIERHYSAQIALWSNSRTAVLWE
ncbi:AMP-binding protein [Pseudomonas sp. Gutcm_11s]|uniref:AMP-binding protein n=1 Tax=Pseudomonas sp. Gutcm_11s TaxID=3026088 RepID=UPI00236016EB|nr:AMP-binding protein [Pseudomonas sp. Gutcm_11s]MDD0843467.1 AMP-binding protein [Pseudomonas sp. Gutcm_11s]